MTRRRPHGRRAAVWSPSIAPDAEFRFKVILSLQDKATLDGLWVVPDFLPAVIRNRIVDAAIAVTQAGDGYHFISNNECAIEQVASRLRARMLRNGPP